MNSSKEHQQTKLFESDSMPQERGIDFWRRCKKEPHCIRLHPDNQPRTRNEAFLRRIVSPTDARSYYDHKSRFIYPTTPVAMEMDAIRNARRKKLEEVRRHTELLKAMINKEKPPPQMDLVSMSARLEKARKEHAAQTPRQAQQKSWAEVRRSSQKGEEGQEKQTIDNS